MYVPDNIDAYSAHEVERERFLRLDARIRADEGRSDQKFDKLDKEEAWQHYTN